MAHCFRRVQPGKPNGVNDTDTWLADRANANLWPIRLAIRLHAVETTTKHTHTVKERASEPDSKAE